MENRRCFGVSSWIGGEIGRSTPSIILIEVSFRAGVDMLEGARNSELVGLRGICSLALPATLSAEGSPTKKLCRRMSASLVGPRRRSDPGIRGILTLIINDSLGYEILRVLGGCDENYS
jgi:hypothetical protein